MDNDTAPLELPNAEPVGFAELVRRMAAAQFPGETDCAALQRAVAEENIAAHLARMVTERRLTVRIRHGLTPLDAPMGEQLRRAVLLPRDLEPLREEFGVVPRFVGAAPPLQLPRADGEGRGKPEGPHPLPTAEMAFAFADLRGWNEARWKKALGNVPEWLKRCRVIPGKQGGASARWDPVKVGAELVKMHQVPQRHVRGRFQSKPALKPWLEAWKTYEAEYLETDPKTPG